MLQHYVSYIDVSTSLFFPSPWNKALCGETKSTSWYYPKSFASQEVDPLVSKYFIRRFFGFQYACIICGADLRTFVSFNLRPSPTAPYEEPTILLPTCLWRGCGSYGGDPTLNGERLHASLSIIRSEFIISRCSCFLEKGLLPPRPSHIWLLNLFFCSIFVFDWLW